jgi:hypothetical protein
MRRWPGWRRCFSKHLVQAISLDALPDIAGRREAVAPSFEQVSYEPSPLLIGIRRLRALIRSSAQRTKNK